MDALQQQLAQLTPEQVAQLLGASGHAQLLQTSQPQSQPSNGTALAEQIELAKQRGNDHFRRKDYALAVEAYSAALALDPRNAVCLSNRAAAHLKLKEYEQAIADCTSAIAVAPSIKPFMRRATARVELHAYADAVNDLVAALAFESDNKECVAKLSALARLAPHPARGVAGVDRRTRIVAALAVASRRGWKAFAVKGNPAPPALNGHSLFIGPGGRVHLFGGRSVRDQAPQVYALDASDWTWDVVATTGTPPTSRAWHSLSLIDDAASAVCVYGGVSSQGEDASVYVLSASAPGSPPSTSSRLCWTQPRIVPSASSSSVPSPRSGHAAVRIAQSATETETLVFGGRTKRGVSDQLFILRHARTDSRCDDWTCTWEEVAKTEPWPAPRDGHSLCVVPSSGSTTARVVLFGGNGQQNDDKHNDTWVFDTATRQWHELTYLDGCVVPPPRSYHTAHVLGACVFVVAGRMRDAEDSAVYMLDTVSREWFHVPIPDARTLSPRAWHASVLTRDHAVVLLGGGTFTGPRSDAAVLDLAPFAALMADDAATTAQRMQTA